jgi:P4 family phage/plasmid primase-like protien
MEVVIAFLNNFIVKKDTDGKPITHTGMPPYPGKWSIPEKKLNKFYKLISECYAKGVLQIPIVEKMGQYFPFVIDIDLKYKKEITERQYNSDNIEALLEYLWSKIDGCIENAKDKNTVFLMEKVKPYPCKKGEFKMKDGLHLGFPDIIIEKSVYKQLISVIQEEDKIKSIFSEGCEVPPDNDTKAILDSSFSSWQLYGCGKQGESPYIVTKVYKIADDGYPEELEQDLFNEYYTNAKTILNQMTMCYIKKDNVSYNDEFLKSFKVKQSSSSSSVSSMIKNDEEDIYGMNYYVDNNNIINPFKLVEEEELKLVKGLVKCLSVERASDYGSWLRVGAGLHNINRDALLETWQEFSMKYQSYADGTSKRCGTLDYRWKSFDNYEGAKRGIASLKREAELDNPNMYKKVMNESLKTHVEKSVRSGSDADYLVAKVVYERYKDEFISVNVKDEWFHFNGQRWERTLEGTILKNKIHNEIYNLYYEYQSYYHDKKQEEIQKLQINGEDPSEVMEGKSGYGKLLKNIMNIQMKLLQGSYVNGVMKNLRDMFYKKEIMEKFDTDTSLLGFDNGVYDLKNNEFREGRPEDYITMSTRVSMPVKPEQMPLALDDMLESFNNIDVNAFPEMRNYKRFYDDMNDFIDKIVPIPAVKNYTLRFLSKCLSGENRDEGFYIWTGTGGNGKSKLIDLTSMCMGEYACNLPIALLTQKRKASGAASPEMAVTRGKRLAVMQEPDVNETLNVGQMKEITGNDKITARGLYKEPFEFTPQFKLVCMCNDLPHIPSNDDGTWRRLEVVDFIARFVDYDHEVDVDKHRYLKDKSIKNKIPMWVIPFFAIILPHWREYDKHGIDIPNEVKAKTNAYRNNNDLVGQWIDQNCIEEENILATDGIMELAPTDFDTLYDNFVEWCQEEEVNNRPDKKSVKTALKKWQEKSRFGLSFGSKKSEAEGMPNGYEKAMRFNLKIV